MSLNKVPSGQNLPDDFNVIIEIPMHGEPVKNEVDKESGAIFVDRFMNTAMHYPCNYGYILHTLSDGRPGGRAGDHAGATEHRGRGALSPARGTDDGG